MKGWVEFPYWQHFYDLFRAYQLDEKEYPGQEAYEIPARLQFKAPAPGLTYAERGCARTRYPGGRC